jgi:uncharacterized surface protein with fasciclin (FAS1) repeats
MNPIRIWALAVGTSSAALGAAAFAPALAELSVEVGGAPMYASKNFIENLSASKEFSALVVAIQAADLDATLQGDGPFTFFAPANRAFEKLPKAAADTLLQPENKAALTATLAYHLISGKYSAADFIDAIKKGGGKAAFKTVEGEELTVEQDGRKLIVIDAKGDRAIVIIPDVNQKNGVIHVIDAVLSPKS